MIIPQYRAGCPHVTHPSATKINKNPAEALILSIFVRLACVKHAASVHPEPGSNSYVKVFVPSQFFWLTPVFLKPAKILVHYLISFRSFYAAIDIVFLLCKNRSILHHSAPPATFGHMVALCKRFRIPLTELTMGCVFSLTLFYFQSSQHFRSARIILAKVPHLVKHNFQLFSNFFQKILKKAKEPRKIKVLPFHTFCFYFSKTIFLNTSPMFSAITSAALLS